MSKKVDEIKAKQHELEWRQFELQNQLMGDCVDPAKGLPVLHELMTNAVRHYQNQEELILELQRSRKNWFERTFGR
jgi:hypothetical protein